MKKGFQLLDFQVEERNQLINYQFSTVRKKESTSPYTSLLIGPNGTGKSRLLRSLADAFNDLYLFYNDGNTVERNELFVTRNNFILKYLLDGVKFEIIKTGSSGLEYRVNEKQVSYDQIKLPSKLICVSYNISDKFPVTFSNPLSTRSDRYDNNFYNYLGIKVQRNSATPTGHVYRTLDLLTSKTQSDYFHKNANSIFEFLDFKPHIRLEYTVGVLSFSDNFLTGNLTVNKFKDIVVELSSKGRLSGFAFNSFQKLATDETGILPEFVKYLNQLAGRKREKFFLEFNFSKEKIISEKDEVDYKFLNLCRKLKIVNYRNLEVERLNGESFSFKDSSSGQNHILTSMLSIASVIDNNSIILIDEPETSLHPNWQMKYFDLVYKAFDQLNSCHFVVASHSHFLVSDMRSDSSSILSITRNEESQIETKLIPFNTFGWSAEQILLEVFNVPTTRNLFVADLVGNILNMIADPDKNIQKIETEVSKLLLYNLDKLDKADPLKTIIDKLIKKYGKKEKS